MEKEDHESSDRQRTLLKRHDTKNMCEHMSVWRLADENWQKSPRKDEILIICWRWHSHVCVGKTCKRKHRESKSKLN